MVRENVRLRLEAENGWPTQEYRINNETVEVRSLLATSSACDAPEGPWRRVTRQQLRHHVERNTVVAQWLERRLGWRRLLHACVDQELEDWAALEVYGDRRAA